MTAEGLRRDQPRRPRGARAASTGAVAGRIYRDVYCCATVEPTHAVLTRRRRVAVTCGDVTAVLLAGRLEPTEAVVLIDQMVAARAADLDRIRTLATSLTGRFSARARAAVALADGLAGSPQETRLRLLLRASSLPRPVAQFEVHDAVGRFVARVDFAWPEHRLALEYEGTWHGEPQQVGKDRRA